MLQKTRETRHPHLVELGVEHVHLRVFVNDALDLVLCLACADRDEVGAVHEAEVAHDSLGAVKQVLQVAEEAVLAATNNTRSECCYWIQLNS